MTKENLVRKIKEQINVAKSLNVGIERMEKILRISDSLKIENIDTFDKIDETYDYKSLIRAIEILDDIIKLSEEVLNVYLDCFGKHTEDVLKRGKSGW